jgi:hypothetical protein
MSGRHAAPVPEVKSKPIPKEQQVRPDAANPGYDHPSTFGRGWRR